MAETSKIEWTHATFNPWEGCAKVSPGCQNCYAEARANRWQTVQWGPSGTRRIAAESYWKQPLKWDREAKAAGERRRVFCASLADVFEDWKGPMETGHGVQWWKRRDGSWTTSDHYPDTFALTMNDVRDRLFRLIAATPNLDWLLLTKRPENVLKMTYQEWCRPIPGHVSQNEGDGRCWAWPKNVWLGVSVEDQQRADERISLLLKIPAAVRFLSMEPLLAAVDLTTLRRDDPEQTDCLHGWRPHAGPEGANTSRVDWVIIGGESGPGSRPMQLQWARSLVKQCQAAGTAVFVKQLGASPVVDAPPGPYAAQDTRRLLPLTIHDKKGGDMAEWPADLRVREFPRVTA